MAMKAVVLFKLYYIFLFEFWGRRTKTLYKVHESFYRGIKNQPKCKKVTGAGFSGILIRLRSILIRLFTLFTLFKFLKFKIEN